MNRHKLLVLFGLVISIVTGFGPRASTQPYPDKPVNLVVGVSVGGLVDLATRQAAEQLQKKLGTPVLVQTRTGAGGAVAAQFVAQSQPDGYNLLSLTSGTFTAADLQKKPPYTVSDFIPIAMIAEGGGVVIAVRKGLSISNFQELLAYAKANPNKLTYGSSGTGGPVHLTILQLLDRANVEMTHVPYRGAIPATQAVLQGEVDLTLVDPSGFAQQIKDGLIVPVARVADPPARGAERFPKVADFFPGYDAKLWIGLAAPARTPPGVIEKLNTTMNAIISEGLITEPIAKLGLAVTPMKQSEFQKYVEEDAQRWGDLIRKHNITME